MSRILFDSFDSNAPVPVYVGGGLSIYGANRLGALAFGGASFTQPTVYAQPNVVQPAEDGTGAVVPSDGYASRVTVTFEEVSGQVALMTVPRSLYTADDSLEELDSVALFDATSSGNLLALAQPTEAFAVEASKVVTVILLALRVSSGPMQSGLVNALLSHLCGGAPYTPDTQLQIGLISSGSTEISGGDYSRVTVDNDGTFWATWSNCRTSNLQDITWGPASTDWETATRFGIWSGDGTTLLWVDDFPSSITVTSGNYGRIPVGDLRLQLTSDFGPSVGEPIVGAWYNVTDPSMDMSDTVNGNDSYGVQDIVFDPVRPQDAYAFLCFQGVWKSTDYGKTWAKVSTTATLDTGKLWSAAIDPDVTRDPNTPPTLWTLNGTGGVQGVFRSTDGGVTWTHYNTGGPSEDVYQIVVDPYDKTHLLCTFHGDPQVYESFNGGVSWAIGGVSPGNGVSGYVFFIDTGNASTTADTWIHVPQDGEGLGARRTTNGGSSWTTVRSNAHHSHGGFQIAQLGGGTLVMASSGDGIYESTDYGASWTMVDATQPGLSFACNTSNYVWVWNSFPAHFTIDHRLRRRPVGGGSYTALTGVNPSLTNGGKNMAVSTKGGRNVLLMGCWQAGIWRWVDP